MKFLKKKKKKGGGGGAGPHGTAHLKGKDRKSYKRKQPLKKKIKGLVRCQAAKRVESVFNGNTLQDLFSS